VEPFILRLPTGILQGFVPAQTALIQLPARGGIFGTGKSEIFGIFFCTFVPIGSAQPAIGLNGNMGKANISKVAGKRLI